MDNYKIKINALGTAFSSAIDNFHNTYIVHHTNPESTEYTQIYSRDMGQISEINTALFTLQNSVQTSIDSLNKQISLIDIKLKKEKELNTSLHRKLGDKRGKSLGSEELITETQEMYNYQLIKNITLFIGDVILLYLIYKMAV